jgi:hypothetical protein
MAGGQSLEQRSRSEPTIPGAVVEAPEWLKAGAPFDVAGFLKLPRPTENGAPLYLDAFFEFSPDVATCFPPGPATDARREAGRARMDAINTLHMAWSADGKSVTSQQVEEALAPLANGFRLLELAQARSECAFVTGLTASAPPPHFQGARVVARALVLRAGFALRRGDVGSSVRDLGRLFRLASDIRRRGGVVAGMMSNTLTLVGIFEIAKPALQSSSLTAEHCDAILALFTARLAESAGMAREALKGEYLAQRILLHDFADGVREIGSLPPGEFRARIESLLATRSDRLLTENIGSRAFENLRSSPLAEIAKAEQLVGRVYRAIDGLETRTWAERANAGAKVLEEERARVSTAIPALVVVDAMHDPDQVALSETYSRANVAGWMSLVALRRWRLTTSVAPTDLSAILNASGIRGIPVDPYDGRPLRFLTIAGSPTIYSVGKDLKDDGGLVDSNHDRAPGDLIFRLAD